MGQSVTRHSRDKRRSRSLRTRAAAMLHLARASRGLYIVYAACTLSTSISMTTPTLFAARSLARELQEKPSDVIYSVCMYILCSFSTHRFYIHCRVYTTRPRFSLVAFI